MLTALVDRRVSSHALEWPGSMVAILASGPSLDAEQIAAVRAWRAAAGAGERRVIVINTTFRAAPWADVLYAADARWWGVYGREARETFLGELWTQAWWRDPREARACEAAGLRWMASERQPGLSTTPGLIRTGCYNSGGQAINLALLAGARRVIMLGFDFRRANGKTHHHGDHPKPLTGSQPFLLWIKQFDQLAEDAAHAGLELVNCTPGSALRCVPTMSLAEALA